MRKCRNVHRSPVERLFLTGGILAAVVSGPAWAQQAGGGADTGTDTQAGEVVVTATRLGVGLPGTSTTVIKADDIANSPARTLPDLLSREAGIQTHGFYSAAGADMSVDMRGFGATAGQNTLVLINGRRINDVDLSGVDWTNIPIDSIQSIEITRGNSGAVLYGEGAEGGVINIITKSEVPQGPSGKMTATYGSYDHYETDISLSHGVGPVSLSAYGSLIDTDNYRQNNELRQGNLVTEARRHGDDGDIYANLRLEDQRLHTPGSRSVTPTSTQLKPDNVRRGTGHPNDYANKKEFALTLGGTHQITNGLEAVVDTGYRFKTSQSYLYSSFGSSYIDTDLGTWSLTPRLNLDYTLGERASTATLGIDYYYSNYHSDRQVEATSAPFHRYDANQHSAAIYAQNTLVLTDRLNLATGGRVQFIRFTAGDNYDASLAPWPGSDGHRATLTDNSVDIAFNLGLDYRLTDTVALFGRLARSFRAPTLDERIGSDSSYHSFTLKTQTSRDAEVGTRLTFGKVQTQSSVYYMALRDELHANPDTYVNANFDPTRRYGVENSLDWQASDTVKVKGNLTYTKAEFTEGSFKGSEVPLVSEWTANTSVAWDIIGKQLTGTATASYYGPKVKDGDEANNERQIPGYTLVDLKLGGKYQAFNWSASINNVFDVDYYDYAYAYAPGSFSAYPMPGRTYWVEAGVNF